MAARGGKREGAGRKPGIVAQETARSTAGDILAKLNDREAWDWAYQTARANEDAKTVVDILKYLTDRRDGKAPQAITMNKESRIVVQFTRDPETPSVKTPDKPTL